MLDPLLRGFEPDAGTLAKVTLVGSTTGLRQSVPVPTALPRGAGGPRPLREG